MKVFAVNILFDKKSGPKFIPYSRDYILNVIVKTEFCCTNNLSKWILFKEVPILNKEEKESCISINFNIILLYIRVFLDFIL